MKSLLVSALSASCFTFWVLCSFFLFNSCQLGEVEALNGTVTVHVINSTILGFQREIQVYLPAHYNQTDETKTYPVIYFLHGFTGNHLSFGYINNVLDDLIHGPEAVTPMIIIKPNGALNGTTVGSLWANSVINGRYEDYFFQEVMPWAEENFRVARESKRRFIMGHSFGGSAAMRFIFEHRDLFGSVACHSGFVKMDRWLVEYYVNVSVFEEFNRTAVVPSGFSKIFTLFIFTASKAWSPNPQAPYQVDLPMINDGTGTIRQDIVEKWEAFSPHTILQNRLQEIKSNPPHLLYFDIGSRDELLLLQPNLEFAGILLNDQMTYLLKVYNGPHNDPVLLEQRFRQSIASWNSIASVPVTVDHSTSEQIQSESDETPSSKSFPYGLVIGIIVAVLAVSILAIVGTYLVVTSKFHILFLDKKLTADDEEE